MDTMKRVLQLLSLCVAVALISTPALASGNINLALGQRALDDSDFGPVDEQFFFGASVDWDMEWPVNLAGGLYFSSEDDSIGTTDISASVTEITFGVMKNWESHGRMHPFVGGGLGIVQVSAEIDDPTAGSLSEDDTAPALYTEGGVYWRIGHAFNLGVHGRYMMAPGIEIAGSDFDTNYFQVGLLAGWSWGTK